MNSGQAGFIYWNKRRDSMEKASYNSKTKVSSVLLKALLFSGIITVMILLLLSLFVYKADVGDQIIKASVVVTYIVSCFIGGLLSGKGMRERKFLWGLICGCIYVAIVLMISLMLGGQKEGGFANYTSMLLLCLGSGMLGGMVS